MEETQIIPAFFFGKLPNEQLFKHIDLRETMILGHECKRLLRVAIVVVCEEGVT